jgi:hypothetical protein
MEEIQNHINRTIMANPSKVGDAKLQGLHWSFQNASQLPNTGLRPICAEIKGVCIMQWFIVSFLLGVFLLFLFSLMVVSKRADRIMDEWLEKELAELENSTNKLKNYIEVG